MLDNYNKELLLKCIKCYSKKISNDKYLAWGGNGGKEFKLLQKKEYEQIMENLIKLKTRLEGGVLEC